MAAGFRTVREAVNDPELGPWLERLLFDEVVPVLEGRVEGPAAFARQVLDRFSNPFIEHKLADIARAPRDARCRCGWCRRATSTGRSSAETPALLSEVLAMPTPG